MPYVNESGRRVTRRRIWVWTVVYEAGGGKNPHRVIVTSLTKPTKHRVFRVAAKSGRRKFTATKVTKQAKEIWIVAKAKELTDEEIEELEELEDLDDLEDEDEDEEDEDVEEDDDDEEDEEEEEDEDEEDEEEDDEDEDDEDEDEEEDEEEEEPAPRKKSKSKKSKKSKRGGGAKLADGKIGTAEVAAAAGVDGRTLRMVLRKHNIEKDEGRYQWSSLKHPEVKKILKLIKERGEGRKVKKESLDNLKKGRAKKSKKSGSKKRKKSRS